VGGNIIVQYGLQAAPTSFRHIVARFVEGYLGTDENPVPFGGRDAEILRLNQWLESEHAPRNLLVTAPAGRGKTALLVRWIGQLGPEWPVAFVPISIRADTNRPVVFYQALASRLAHLLDRPISSMPIGDPVTFYRENVIELFDQFSKSGKRCLVVVDGLDEASGWTVDATVLPTIPAAGIKVVVSARLLAGDADDRDWKSRLGWLDASRHVTSLSVQPLDRDGVADVLAKLAFPLDRLGKNVDIVDQLHRLTEGGDPLLLTLYVQDLLAKGDEAVSVTPEDLLRFKPGYGYYFDRWFEQLERSWDDEGARIDTDLVDAVMVVLACAKGPLSLRTLGELLERIHPGQRIVSEKTLKPVRRFVIGDGTRTGYVLSHPKLADYLTNERFASGPIIDRARREFVEWGQHVVRALDTGAMKPKDVPAYALLHHAHHLEELDPSDAAELYADLLEEGWLRAWQFYDGGYEGFSRDVTLALQAMRRVAHGDPAKLRAPRIGLGSQLRCVLILSSIRSAGMETPGELLAEFLAEGLISPRQALYLVSLKSEDKRGDALRAIAERLTDDLLPEALAIAYAIAEASQRAAALIAIGRRCGPPEFGRILETVLRLARGSEPPQRASILSLAASAPPSEASREGLFMEALASVAEIPAPHARNSALLEVRDAIREVFQEVPAILESRLGEITRDILQAFDEPTSRPMRSFTQSGEPAQSGESFFHDYGATTPFRDDLGSDAAVSMLLGAIGDPEVSHWRIREAFQIFFAGGSHVSPTTSDEKEKQVSVLLEAILAQDDLSRQADLLRALAPHLTSGFSWRIVEHVMNVESLSSYDRTMILSALAPTLDAEQIAAGIELAKELQSKYERSDACAVLLAQLPDTQLGDQLLTLLDDPDRFSLDMVVRRVGSRLGEDLLKRLVSASGFLEFEFEKRDLLLALVPILPEGLLANAVHIAGEMQDQEMRGSILVELLRRVRASGVEGKLSGLQETAFLINDHHASVLALAALYGELPDPDRAWIANSVLKNGGWSSTTAQLDDLLFGAVALAVIASSCTTPESRTAILSALSEIQLRERDETAWFAQMLLVTRLPTNEAAEALATLLQQEASGKTDVRFLSAAFAPSAELAAQALASDLQEPDNTMLIMRALASALAASSDNQVTVNRLQFAMEQLRDTKDLDEEMIPVIAILVAAVATPLAMILPEESGRTWFAQVQTQLKLDTELQQLLRLSSPWIAGSDLIRELDNILDLAAKATRSIILLMLCISGGSLSELLRSNPRFASRPRRDSPLRRIGGEATVVETAHAIKDVTSWWP